jgi:hypothetical protein
MDIDLTHVDWNSAPSIVGAVSQLVMSTEQLKGVTPEARATLVVQTLTKAIESTPLDPEVKVFAEKFVAEVVPHVISAVIVLLSTVQEKVEEKLQSVAVAVATKCGCFL